MDRGWGGGSSDQTCLVWIGDCGGGGSSHQAGLVWIGDCGGGGVVIRLVLC